MKLPAWLHPILLWLRHVVGRWQHWPTAPISTGTIPQLPHGLKQPDATSCGSSVLVAMEMLNGKEVNNFGQAALAMRRQTNGLIDVSGHLQLPWPAGLGTRPAALIRQLGGGWRNHVVDPRRRGAGYQAILSWVRSGQPVPLYIGEGSWMQHIVLVVGASESALDIYDPACGEVLRRTREQFETARLDVAGWDQPWLVILPKSAPRSPA